jgi:hypothetical protein
MIELLLKTLCRHQIRQAQSSIGLVPYKVDLDENGMMNLGDIMNQPIHFDIYLAKNYDFKKKRSKGRHIVIFSEVYKLLEFSPDPRDGTIENEFSSFIDIVRKCTISQITTAVHLSMKHDEKDKLIDTKWTFDEIHLYTELKKRYKKILVDKLERHLRSPKALFISWLIAQLSKVPNHTMKRPVDS